MLRRFQPLLSIFNTRHYNLELKASVEIQNSGMDFLDNLQLSGQYLSDCNGHTVTTIKAVFGSDEKFDLIPGVLAVPLPSAITLVIEKAPAGWDDDPDNPALNAMMITAQITPLISLGLGRVVLGGMARSLLHFSSCSMLVFFVGCLDELKCFSYKNSSKVVSS